MSLLRSLKAGSTYFQMLIYDYPHLTVQVSGYAVLRVQQIWRTQVQRETDISPVSSFVMKRFCSQAVVVCQGRP